jgi:selenocysteine lyase/cysteine desulfurase
VTALPREQFPVVERYRYFDHAGVAPISKAAADAARWWADHTEHHGNARYEETEARIQRTREDAARIMGVPVADIALVKNTTEGTAFVASGLGWQPGDRVVVPDLEFPSTIFPWMALRDRGVQVDLVAPEGDAGALTVEAFAAVINDGPPPKIVATSWVQFSRGWRTDLQALARVCHEAGSLLCADVMQGVGVIPADLEMWGVDFATVGSHKWLCAPRGFGVLYVASRVRDLLRPLEPGWASVAKPGRWDTLVLDFAHSARRFEGGSQNVVGAIGLGASLDLLLSTGIERIWSHVDALCDRLAGGLSSIDGARVLSDRTSDGRSGITSFVVDGQSPVDTATALIGMDFVCAARGGGVRISPHGYNDESEIDALVEAVERLATIK